MQSCQAESVTYAQERTMSRRRSYTDKRRARLAKKVDRLDRLETRNTITEPISVFGLSVGGLRALAQFGIISPVGARNVPRDPVALREQGAANGGRAAPGSAAMSVAIGLRPGRPPAGGGASGELAAADRPTRSSEVGDWLTLSAPAQPAPSDQTGISSPWKPATRAGGGAAMAPRGGSGNGVLPATLALVRGQIAPLHVPQPGLAPSTPGGGGASAALLAALAGSSQGNGNSSAPGSAPQSARLLPSTHRTAPSLPGVPGGGQKPGPGHNPRPMTSGGSTPPSSIPDPVIGTSSGPSQDSFPYFAIYVLDNNDGVVMFPGADQFASLNGVVELEAQVSGATVSSYNWNTSGLGTDAKNIAGTTTYDLTFQWTANNPSAAHDDTITLSVKDTSNQFETYTYDFWVPSGTGPGGSGGGSNATWPATIVPDTELLDAPSFATDDGSVDATSGALDTTIDHLYGADICLQAAERGLAVVAIEALCHHNSRTIGLPEAFFASAEVFARKWKHRLPVATPCVIIDPAGGVQHLGNATDAPGSIAYALGRCGSEGASRSLQNAP
jgi:hypothetical protein